MPHCQDCKEAEKNTTVQLGIDSFLLVWLPRPRPYPVIGGPSGRGWAPPLTGDDRGSHGLQGGANANVRDQGRSEARPFRGMAAVSSQPPGM